MGEENGLNYMRARYFSAREARFINKDPIGFYGGLNLYAYAGNAPTIYTDPSGKIFPAVLVVPTAWALLVTLTAGFIAEYALPAFGHEFEGLPPHDETEPFEPFNPLREPNRCPYRR